MNSTTAERILLVEDDPSLISGLSFALKKEGYETDVARCVDEAKKMFTAGTYDLLLLDVTLPDGTGYEICEYVRRISDVAVIFLTAADEEVDIIMGLDMGGDDYITKPFKLGVLMSRIHALLRRTSAVKNESTELSSCGIRINLLKGEVLKNEKPIVLTAGEYKLLCYLMSNPGAVLTKEQILAKLWDCEENFINNNTLTVYIRRLREKIEDNPGEPARILTVRGLGYKWGA